MIFNSSNSSSKQRRNAVFEMNNEERNGLKVFLREHIKSKQPKEWKQIRVEFLNDKTPELRISFWEHSKKINQRENDEEKRSLMVFLPLPTNQIEKNKMNKLLYDKHQEDRWMAKHLISQFSIMNFTIGNEWLTVWKIK